MQDFEKLGLFYLGRRVDAGTGRTLDEPLLYDSRDLLTHAFCVGMTGSGKTGLCMSLIEEAAIDGVPVVAIDPKGDLGNLLLTFPHLSAAEFAPWIDEDEARRQGRDPAAHAAEEARRWRSGLADWGQDDARIQRLRDAAEFAIYTPGSRAGRPVSILSSFAAPPASAREDSEQLAERSAGTATSVLALAGVDAPPRSREHTLVASLLTAAWRTGRDLDLPQLIQQLQSPPFQKVGVLDLESFFPSADRFALAMRVNALLAAPGFDVWLEGASLDPAALLYTADGRPRVAIFAIAHLSDAERMFFVSLFLNHILGWMRRQPGTSSLRALVYMDEIMGYFPPVANPPSKPPLLAMLKQGRAFGVATVLATQNPVDLDYRGLSNIGTWFLGRLQTEGDKQRVLDGLEGAAAGRLARGDADRLLSSLGKRVFLLHDVHQPAPVLFQTRWTLSYLRGPLSRAEISRLDGQPAAAPEVPASAAPDRQARAGDPLGHSANSGGRTMVPPGIQEFFVPTDAGGAAVRYRPVILGGARVRFWDAKLGVDEARDVLYAAPIAEGAVAVDWRMAERLPLAARDLEREPRAGATFGSVPDVALKPRSHAAWEKALGRHLSQTERIELQRSRELELISKPGESEQDFALRVHDAQREARDAALEKLADKYGPKRTRLEEAVRRAEAAIARETEQASQAKLQTGVSMGAAVLGAIFGRRAVAGTLGRATTAARGVGRSMKEAEDVKRASEGAAAARARAAALEEEIRQETQAIADRYAAPPLLERFTLVPKRGHVAVQFVALGWIPEGTRRS